MQYFTGLIHQGFSFAGPLIILLGVLIFVHELGHFLVAKFFGVRVETFSLGFGRKILKKKFGDTVYCISIIPFGGYVKMYGDDPSTPIPVEEQKYSFTHQKVIPRIAIVLAGPFMNALFAVFLFSVIAGIGEEAIQAKLGDISTGSAAYTAGFRSGDVIDRVNGQSVERWEQVKKSIEENTGKTVEFDILRNSQPTHVAAVPVSTVNKNVLSTKDVVGDIDGFTYLMKGPGIGITDPTGSAAQAGLKTGDVIRKVNGVEIDSWNELTDQLKSDAKIEVERGTSTKLLTFQLPTFNDFESLGLESSELYLASVMPKSGADAAGIQPGDKLSAINGKKIQRWDEVVKNVQSFDPKEEALRVTYVRSGKSTTVAVKPQIVSQPDATGIEQKNYALGVVTGLVLAAPHTFLAKEHGAGKIISKGFDDTVRWTKLTALSFLRLVQRRVSAKSIGGPLMIGKLASETWKIGISPFLKIMGIISINLFVLNLLPIPVLDGGHLLFFSVELVKGSPLSFRKLEIMQQVGMALLFALMAFSFFNDIVRIFAS